MPSRMRYLIGAAALVETLLGSTGGFAQDPPPFACRAFHEAVEADGAPLLRIQCESASVFLGEADAFDLETLPALRSVVGVTSFGGMRRAWLVMSDGERSLHAEEITGTIARSIGRRASARLDNLQLGYPSTAERPGSATMSVRVPGENGARAEIDLGQLVERSRAVRASSTRPTENQPTENKEV